MIRRLSSDWSDTIVVCSKCSKKQDGGFGKKGRQSLAKALRTLLSVKKGRKGAIGIVESRCLGVCPRRAVVVARAGQWLIVSEGTEVDRVAGALGLRQPCSRAGGSLV